MVVRKGLNMKTFPTLYKINSRGKKQYWRIDTTFHSYIICYGQYGGAEQSTEVQVKSGKNIGKANETTIDEQVLKEAEALWNKQKDKGYGETASVKSKESFIRPMLAQGYDKYPDKIKFPCYAQPKLDGVRALAVDGQIISRKGKEFTSCPHIIEEINRFKLSIDGLVLDGELYNHTDNFQDLISFIRREDASLETQAVEYHVYDCFYPNNKASFTFRNTLLQKLFSRHNFKYVKLVETRQVKNNVEVDEFHDDMVEAEYEGAMLRNADAPYLMDKRSYDLLKVKSFQTDEFEIVGAEQNKGRQSNQCTLVCITKDGARFGVKPAGNEKIREEYWTKRKQNIGKMLTVKYFEMTDSNPPVPRFPIGIAIRFDI